MASKKLGITFEGIEYIVEVREIDDKEEIASHITGLDITSALETGFQITPSVITDGTVEIGTDYTVTYGANVEPGTGYVYVNGIGNYAGNVTLTFQIVPDSRESISDHITGITPTSMEYTGEQLKPELVTDGTVEEITDYVVTYGENIEGTGYVFVSAAGQYKGSVTFDFEIIDNRPLITDHITGIDPTEFEYDGEEKKPTVLTDETVELDTDFRIEYINNITPGTGYVNVIGIGEYRGVAVYDFVITGEMKENIGNHIMAINPSIFEYDGEEKIPELITDGTVTLDTDYTVEYMDNVEIGIGHVLINGIGNYEGSLDFQFEIVEEIKENIASHIEGIDPYIFKYDGEAKEPTVLTDGTVTLDMDYIVEYTDNVELGIGHVLINGIGSYEGFLDYEFEIVEEIKENIASHIEGIDPNSFVYDATEKKPTVLTDNTVELNTDYTVEYTDNVEIGIGHVLINGVGEYTGSMDIEFEIMNEEPENSTEDTPNELDQNEASEETQDIPSDDEPENESQSIVKDEEVQEESKSDASTEPSEENLEENSEKSDDEEETQNLESDDEEVENE